MIDKENMKGVLEEFPKQCETALTLSKGIRVKDINKVIVTGIGGSAFTGDVLRAVVEEEIDVIPNKDYSLPKDIDSKTLIFVVSYSGNTEEPLYAIKDAIKNKCKIIGICSGGELEGVCKSEKLDLVRVPSGIQPRSSMGYLVIPMIMILKDSGLIKDRSESLKVMINELKDKKIEDKGKQIADLLFKKIPIIYSSERLKCLSYGWKTRINENSKVHAFAHQIPELDHNELVGYTKKIANFCTVMIRDKDDFIRNKKRFVITKKLIEKLGGEATIIDTVGSTLISRVFCTLYLGDWVSYYLALAYGIDPTPVKIIEHLKKELKK